MWLGTKKGYLQDWLTQIWARTTGRKINPQSNRWLMGPFGQTSGIADTFVQQLMEEENLKLEKNHASFGLLDSIEQLNLPGQDLAKLNPLVKDFYEHTFGYGFEVWSHWCGVFYPFGWLIRLLFSRRLQQLNLPLNPLDSALGIESNIWKLYADGAQHPEYTIWYRILKSQQNVIYSGVYSTTQLPSTNETCLKVVFPLPNGNATVIMKIEMKHDGSLLLTSQGKRFGDPGFYFLLTDQKGTYWAKYVHAMHETIHVYEDEEGDLRTDHVLNLDGVTFLKLHYKMRPKKISASS